MTWRISVVHETSYEYESDVVASFNEVRMTPASGSGQLLVHHRTTVQPFASLFTYRDYWGTTVEAFDLHTPHQTLHVTSENVVETWQPTIAQDTYSWAQLHDPQTTDEFVEYLRHTSLTPQLESVDKLVAAARNAESPLEATRLCTEVVRQNMTYAPRVTDVHTTATDAWLTKQGVCQDYSHIALSLLRSLGIPARYVSGYHYTGNGEIGVPVEVESHAWVEAWTGDWIPFDPTNGKEVDECYVVTAYGRDYGDVSPMRGIFSGGRSKSVAVRVTLTRKHR